MENSIFSLEQGSKGQNGYWCPPCKGKYIILFLLQDILQIYYSLKPHQYITAVHIAVYWFGLQVLLC